MNSAMPTSHRSLSSTLTPDLAFNISRDHDSHSRSKSPSCDRISFIADPVLVFYLSTLRGFRMTLWYDHAVSEAVTSSPSRRVVIHFLIPQGRSRTVEPPCNVHWSMFPSKCNETCSFLNRASFMLSLVYASALRHSFRSDQIWDIPTASRFRGKPSLFFFANTQDLLYSRA